MPADSLTRAAVESVLQCNVLGGQVVRDLVGGDERGLRSATHQLRAMAARIRDAASCLGVDLEG
jgi:hypothetical protein